MLSFLDLLIVCFEPSSAILIHR